MLSTDYLIIGSGALGMAFADEILSHSDADIVMVDRHCAPGGHWNDAYPYVRLHQPSAFYGAGSRRLGSGRLETHGVNAGCYEQASGAEVLAYYDGLMRERFLPSGRVRFLPLTEHEGDGRIRSLASGVSETVRAGKIVDATYFNTSVPSTHTRAFTAEGVDVITPNALPKAIAGRRRFTVLGAGKTGMDACVFLMDMGVPPDAIRWVAPRAFWCTNRETAQPGGGVMERNQASFLEACVAAASVEDLLVRLEQSGQMIRIHPDVRPTMFRGATLSRAEASALSGIRNVVRMGRVERIEPDRILLQKGELPAEADDLYIDCTASAINPGPPVPVFDGPRITLQTVRPGLMCLSAAVAGRIETMSDDDRIKNEMCRPVEWPETLAGYARLQLMGLEAGERWAKDRDFRAWLASHRLSGAGFPQPDRDDPDMAAIRERIAAARGPAMENLRRLAEAAGV